MRSLPKFNTVIFDMDGLIIDSEPLWRESEQAVFQQVGITLSETMCHQTTGLSSAEVVEYWRQRYPWQGASNQQIKTQMEQKVIDLIQQHGRALPGVLSLLKVLKQAGIRMAVASGSAPQIIQAVLAKLEIGEYFELCHSAENEAQGKPHPAVYLTTLAKMGVSAEQCIALEDSVRGMQAAQAAGLFTIVVPESINYQDSGFAQADLKLPTLQSALDNFLLPKVTAAL
ncbi:hexitol phosphatase HxpB [Alteromonadaceae bacterium BrNp21-10]|nr:hexitol phosphatase HxpB [Alteromonadaceae bacterium BrNp21-10]